MQCKYKPNLNLPENELHHFAGPPDTGKWGFSVQEAAVSGPLTHLFPAHRKYSGSVSRPFAACGCDLLNVSNPRFLFPTVLRMVVSVRHM